MDANSSLIYQAFANTSVIPSQVDVQHTPLYDTYTLAAGTALAGRTNTSFFSNVAASAGKTLGQTNMSQPNKLQAPQAFSILSIRFRWSENILAADAFALCNAVALTFWLGSKNYNLAPVWYYTPGAGVYGWSATTVAATTIAAIGNGLPGREAMHKLAIPLVIENQQDFFCYLEGTLTLTAGGSGGTGLTAQTLLDGLYVRAVQ